MQIKVHTGKLEKGWEDIDGNPVWMYWCSCGDVYGSRTKRRLNELVRLHTGETVPATASPASSKTN